MIKPTVHAIGMIILRQPDIAKAVAFYQNIGLALKFHLKDAWAELSLGGVRIGLCPTPEAVEYRTGIVLHVEDLFAFHAAHKEAIEFLGEPKEALHGIMVSFRDPGGNILDLYQPTPEKVAEFARQTAQKEKQGCQKKDFEDSESQGAQCCKSRGSQPCA
jgi:hypothetical protein